VDHPVRIPLDLSAAHIRRGRATGRQGQSESRVTLRPRLTDSDDVVEDHPA